MKISDIMSTHPVTISPEQSLEEAAGIMQRIDAGFLPVGENDRLVGMLTDRDIALRGIGAGKGPKATVGETMTEDVCYCFDDEEVDAVAQNMGEQQVRRLPVVNRDKRLVGVVSIGDIATRQAAPTAGEALEEIVQPSDLHS